MLPSYARGADPLALLTLVYVGLSGLPQTHIVDPASITNRLHLSVLISRPSSKDLAFPEGRDAEEGRQYARIIARNDSLFSRPIKSAICWRSERDREQEKEQPGLVNAEITGGFRVVAILEPHAARLAINPRKFAPC